MGVIKKVLYRGQILDRPRHRHLFLDMEENIHIHYRDLRIELSRGEFEEIAAIFHTQADELLGIIREKGYQDGTLPNSNQEDVRIWTEARLGHGVAYHPRRVSLEECGDGYHLHYRNYKLLLDREDFRRLVKAFQSLDLDSGYAESYDEVLELLEANEVDFVLDRGNIPGETLAIVVARHHLPKVRDIFNYIGFETGEREGLRCYQGARLAVLVRSDNRQRDYRRLREFDHIGRLAAYLGRRGSAVDPDELNDLKCQVLELYYTLRDGAPLHVETDPQLWLYTPGERRVVFPYSPLAQGGREVAETLYRSWAQLLAALELGFVKPTKENFPEARQQALRAQVEETLWREVASCTAVSKVWLMGSAARGDMGRYRVPFVHGKLAKLGSDVDILVEIDPAREGDLPRGWRLVNPTASNHCAVYHLAQIPLAAGDGGWGARLPHLELIHHLVDAYLFFPSRGHAEEKEAFLAKFRAQLFYDRERDGHHFRGREEERVAERMAALYELGPVAVERLPVSTENLLYRVTADERDYVLKLFKVAGNYPHARVGEHIGYEAELIAGLRERGVATAAVIPPVTGEGAVVTVEEWPALLFERLHGEVRKRPEYPLEAIAASLAQLHRVQLERPLALAPAFDFEGFCTMWLDAYDGFLERRAEAGMVAEPLQRLVALVRHWRDGTIRRTLEGRSMALHNHGDVAPKNVLLANEGQALWFDFNNAFFGPRMVDLLDGAFEFSLAEKYVHLADFGRFDRFIDGYRAHAPLTAEEQADLPAWTALIGLIKFTKEVRVLLGGGQNRLREQRALAIYEFLIERIPSI